MSVKIIVIDDDEDTLDVFSTYLEMKHFQVLAKGKDGKADSQKCIHHGFRYHRLGQVS